MVKSVYYPKGKVPNYMYDETSPTLEELRIKSLRELHDPENKPNIKFGLIEAYCINLFGNIDINKLVSTKKSYDTLIFYCLKDIKEGYYKDSNKIDLAIILYEKREESLNRLIGIKGCGEVIQNLLYEIKDSLENSESKNIFNKSLDFLINHYMDILNLKPVLRNTNHQLTNT